MVNSFEDALALYRSCAANAFLRFRSNKLLSTLKKPSKELSVTSPYVRQISPALREYLTSAAAKYAKFKDVPQLKVQSLKRPCVLGSAGKPVLRLAADVRRNRWMISLLEARHLVRSWQHKSHVYIETASIISSCKIPLDIRQKHASRYQATQIAKSTGNDMLMFCRTRPSTLAQQGKLKWTPDDDDNKIAPQPLQPPPSLHHSRRCQLSLAAGEHGLAKQMSPGPTETKLCGSFEETRRRYAGKPDEMYRRKNSRKFASWRRRMQELRLATAKRAENAETNMRATRGYDQLQTQRSYGDRTLAPFLFQSDTHAYAYSSRISEAPKLRKVMIEKYSTLTTVGSAVDPYRKAVEAAENSPLFHTRVMNRFG